ncbi:MAG: glycosyltransferase family 9 protein [Candidatus Eremiobacteraeota bacterium]|nr:glycosyltransferase family 9 protein [Candidatus Eremiobacteraeota bacterium]
MKPHVLLARQDNNGDVILAGPAIRAVRAAARRVTLLCGPRGQQAARLLPCVDEMVVRESEWIDAQPGRVQPGEVAAFVAQLARLQIDQAFILTSFHQSPLPLALLLRMAGVAVIAANCDDYAGSLLDIRHRPSHDIHEVTRSLSLVATLGYGIAKDDDDKLRLRLGERPWLPPFGGDRYIVIHPGATVSARAWSPLHNRNLVAALCRRGERVVVTGGPGETRLGAYVCGAPHDRLMDLAGRTDFAGFARVVASASAVVSGNTAAAHVAAAVQTPVVSIFPPTVPAVRFRPWAVPHVLLGRQDIECAGCRAQVCPVPGHPCVDTVGVNEVIDALETLVPINAVVAS